MEHPQRDNQAERTIESTIRRLELSQALMIHSSGVRLYERLRATHPDEEGEPILIEEAPSVASLVFPQDTVESVPEALPPLPSIPSTVYERLMQPEDIVVAAEESLELRRYTGDAQNTVECFNCRSVGRVQPNCPKCRGIGEVQLRPTLRLMNHLTTQHVDIQLDIAQMLVNRTVAAEWDLQTSGTTGRVTTIGSLGIALTPLFERAAESIGVDTRRTAVEDEEQYLADLPFCTPPATGLHMTYDHGNDKISMNTVRSKKREPVTPLVVLSHIEANTIRLYNAGLYSGHDNEQLARPPLVMRPLRQTEEALDDLVSSVEAFGGTLWAHWAYYGQENRGIEFVIQRPGQPDITLTCEENIHLGIENSWIRLQRIIQGLEDPYTY